MKKQLTIFSGAGISAESGISTFRDADGLWEGHDVMEVASPAGWVKNQELVLDFYNQRRKQLQEVDVNAAHKIIAALESDFDVCVITQNVDDLHERAGSTNVVHLHGELLKVRSTYDSSEVLNWTKDLNNGDLCSSGHQLRPHIVWFGEAVPMLEKAAQLTAKSDILIVIGTSLQVYPAASLIGYAPTHCKVYYIDPKPFISHELKLRDHEVIAEKATIGMKKLQERLISH